MNTVIIAIALIYQSVIGYYERCENHYIAIVQVQTFFFRITELDRADVAPTKRLRILDC